MGFLTFKRTIDKGHYAEGIAKQFLEKEGLHCITSNYTCRVGEIDLIGKHQQSIVFIEVRYRKTSHYGSPLESVTLQKQKKIIKAASYYLKQNKHLSNHPCRFDVVSMTPNPQKKIPDIEWVQRCFWQ